MPHIELAGVDVDFPIYNARGRSLKSDIMRRIGGHIEMDDARVVVRALRGLNLSLKPGDRLAVVGHNGAGKSTLLRVLAGVYEPVNGEIRRQGRVSSLLDMTMGMDMELSGSENVVLRGVFMGMSFEEARSKVPEVAEFSELGDFLHLPMRTYSSGMQLRLAFGISTVNQPDIVILDELISVGDAGFQDKALHRIKGLIDNASILVLASHDTGTLRKFCNRAILMRGGECVQEGSVEQVLEHYVE